MQLATRGASDSEQPANLHKNTLRCGKQVLILDFDLYKLVGGGQSSYRRLIEQLPENTYYYFVRDESIADSRPINAKPIPYDISYYANVGNIPAEMRHFYEEYLAVWQMAAAVDKALPGHSFDVVDTPDYVARGLFARCAMQSHGIRVGVIALALHGTISSAIRDEWRTGGSSPSRLLAELRLKEHLQYRAVDVRYALSATYAKEWETYTGLAARPLDPMLMVGGEIEPRTAPAGGPPDVYFVGRRERRKGPDLFVDLGWCLEKSSYNEMLLVGGDSTGQSGVSSETLLPQMARLRNMSIKYLLPQTQCVLNEAFQKRSIVVLPSRYDQFNLVALEALRLGCPTFVSSRAGMADWLRRNFPTLTRSHHRRRLQPFRGWRNPRGIGRLRWLSPIFGTRVVPRPDARRRSRSGPRDL